MDEIIPIPGESGEDPEEHMEEIPGSLIALEQTVKSNPSVNTGLIRQAIAGDKDAFSQLFRLTYQYVYLTVKHYLQNEEDIYDAVQDTYMKALAHIHRLKVPEAFFTWLHHIAQNTAKNLRSREAVRKASSLSAAEEAVYLPGILRDELPDREVSLDIASVLERMPEKHAQLLVMVYYDGMKLTDIARLLHEPASTVRSRFHAAKKALREALRAKGIDKPIYSGGVLTMLTTSMRNAVGTELLSAAVAQDILDHVLSGTASKHKEGAAAARVARQQRNAAILRLASLVVALSVGASGLTVFVWTAKPFSRLARPAPLPALSASSGGGDAAPPEKAPSAGHTDSPAVPPLSTAPDGAPLPPASGQTGGASGTAGTGAPNGAGASAGSPSSPGAPNGTGASAASPSKNTSSAASGQAPATTAPPVFVPDYRPGKAKTRSRLNRNLLGWAAIDRQDQWVYVFGEDGSYKMRFDGTGGRVALPDIYRDSQAEVIGDWIYYLDGRTLRRLRTDGLVNQELHSAVRDFCIDGGTLTYCEQEPPAYGSNTSKRSIYAAGLDGKNARLLWSTGAPYSYDKVFCVLPERIVIKDSETDAFTLDGQSLSPYALPTWGTGWFYGNAWYYAEAVSCMTRIPFSGAHPTRTEHFYKKDDPAGIYTVEFMDIQSGRFGVAYHLHGEPAENFSSRWVSLDGSLLGERPGVLKTTFEEQRFCSYEDGWIFSVKQNKRLFRCKADGSGYLEYT